jgi:AcrR family transcriptional regulator
VARKPARSTQKTRLEEARARMYRDLVLESAEHVFARKGFDDATMQEIAGEAGISLKTLYATVAGKNELYDLVVETRGAEFLQETAAAMQEDVGVLDTLVAGVRAYVSFLVRHENYLLIHLRQGRAWGLPGLEGPGGVQRDQGESLFQIVAQRGIREGLFYDEDPQTLARSGMAVMQVHLARVAEGIQAGDVEAVADGVLASLLRLLCRPEVLAANNLPGDDS